MLEDKKELIIYQTPHGKLDIQLDLENETIWLDRSQIAALYGIDRSGVSKHIKNIFTDKEIDEKSNVQKMHIPNSDKPVEFFSLDIILAVGYRTNSAIAIMFRKWATQTLKEYIIKGFVLNSERLKNPGGWDYFDELLEKIREIRASEKRFYQKVRDLFSLSVDYDKNDEKTQLFFALVQNKLLYAVTNMTAAEIIKNRSDDNLPNMGLKSFQGEKVLKRDIYTAKNYLNENEIKELDRFVVMFLDYAENQTLRKKQIRVDDWKNNVDKFIEFNEYDILQGNGSVSKKEADKIAEKKYKKFDEQRKKQEAIEADQYDLRELQAIEAELIEAKKYPKGEK